MSSRKRNPAKLKPAPETGVELLSGQRQKGESDVAVIACNDWLRMGIGRSMSALIQHYKEAYIGLPPTTVYQTLKDWSHDFKWAERASFYDATWEQRKNAEREAVLNYGLALDYERLRKLYRLAAFLEAQIYELSAPDFLGQQTYHNVWVPDVKSIGGGEYAERVDIERFNSPLFEQYRKCLDDIAQETGGRAKQVKVNDWRSQAIADIRAGKIPFGMMVELFDRSLAEQLFAQAGVPIE